MTRPFTIADYIVDHANVAKSLDPTVPNQNDWRFALFGVMAEIGEVLEILPWRPWRADDQRAPTSVELGAVLPELADVVSAVFRAVANLGIDPIAFENACIAHLKTKHARIQSGQDR